MNTKIKIGSSLLVTLLLAVLTACSNSNSGSGGDGMGSLTLGITDAPVDEALAVVVEFTGVNLKGQGNDDPVTVIEFEQPKVINLLDLQGSNSEILLQDISLAAGDYHHQIGINTWAGVGAPPPLEDSLGLQSFTITLPKSDDLENLKQNIRRAGKIINPIDHGFSIQDPSANRIQFKTAQGSD